MQNSQDFPKNYTSQAVEEGLYKRWEESGVFNPDSLPDRNKTGEPYCILMPPPNRTGTLHMGHASMLAIQDVLIRFYRLRGRKTLWIPGTDHASIATETKVEQLLQKQGMKNPRAELGREEFLKRVVTFANDSADTIRRQTRLMGSSCDWSRERYTFDEPRNRAVNEVFRLMWEDGVIERGDRIVNWDPKMQTTIADDEMERKEEKAPFYTFQYGPFQIGTSRPETKFGDKYVVMHPEDPRYAQYKTGDTFEAEWINGPVKATVIKDAVIDQEFGTGVMTITPWHDMVDFELAERHHLDREQVIDYDGRMLPIAGPEFVGLTIEEARVKVVERLKEKGLLVSVDENYIHNVAVSYRGGGRIEPQIKRQWFVRVNKPFTLRQDTLGRWKKGEKVTLKELMQHAVRSGQTKIVPDRFFATYFRWIDNLRDWCISRQIWFGHRIPVWYRVPATWQSGDVMPADAEMKFSETLPGEGWVQDPDTLDTWFSSGMWTFSALGWPDKAEWEKHRAYHPAAVLETGYDIIFFWVARMILMSTYTLGEVPFSDVYLHGMVVDDQGRKMSKSLGNILDPVELIPKYGTDAVRLSLLMGTTPGQDVKLSEAKIEGFKLFANKLWNISRFCVMQMEDETVSPETLADQWLKTRLAGTVASVTKKIETYQFSSAAEELRDFTWSELADWYLEISKVEKGKAAILRETLKTILILWHPFMPFVTEEIWRLAGYEGLLALAEWPMQPVVAGEQGVLEAFSALQAIVTDIRRVRAEQGVEAGKQLECVIKASPAQRLTIDANAEWLKRLAGLNALLCGEEVPEGWGAYASGQMVIALNLDAAIDHEAEREKAAKELVAVEAYIVSLDQKLANQEFTSKAPAKVIDEMKKKQEEAKAKREVLLKKI